MTTLTDTVQSTYHYNTGAEMQAYRFIGLAARLCLELGLHRSEIVTEMFDTPEAVHDAVRLFWVVYVCDKRWAFSTGLDFAIRDEEIDPKLPMPDDSYPYLKMLTFYCRISARFWSSTGAFDTTGMVLRTDDMSWLDWQISQWQNEIPEELRFTHLDLDPTTDIAQPHQRRIRTMLHVRSNHLRIMLYRPVLFTVTNAVENRGFAQTVVEIAKDNIRTMSDLDKSGKQYGHEQVVSHSLLIQGLGVLLLAVAQLPVDFARQVREEFYLALDLIKLATLNTSIMQRLSKCIQKLKRVVLKIEGIIPGADPHSSAAIAMAGLAGHAIGNGTWNPAGSTPAKSSSSTDPTPFDGTQISLDLGQLFELACGYGETLIVEHDALLMNGMDAATAAPIGTKTLASVFRNGDLTRESELEFARAIKEIL